MSESRPVYTTNAEVFRDVTALRPVKANAPRPKQRRPAYAVQGAGLCPCGCERRWTNEDDALELRAHIWPLMRKILAKEERRKRAAQSRYRANQAAAKERTRQWQLANREKYLAYLREYKRKLPPEKLAEQKRKAEEKRRIRRRTDPEWHQRELEGRRERHRRQKESSLQMAQNNGA